MDLNRLIGLNSITNTVTTDFSQKKKVFLRDRRNNLITLKLTRKNSLFVLSH